MRCAIEASESTIFSRVLSNDVSTEHLNAQTDALRALPGLPTFVGTWHSGKTGFRRPHATRQRNVAAAKRENRA
eukprot:9334178-Prorocentrum_lima.AAC.1